MHATKLGCVILVLVLCGFGCSEYTSSFVIEGSVKTATPTCTFPKKDLLDSLHLAMPTVGLFIGVSEYDEKAGVYSMPAHAISAGLFQSPFFQAAFFHTPEAKEMWLTDSDKEARAKWQKGEWNFSYVDKNDLAGSYWLKTIADTNLDLSDPVALGAFRILMQIPGIKWKKASFYAELAKVEAYNSPELGEYAYIGEDVSRPNFVNVERVSKGEKGDDVLSKPVDKARIRKSIEEAIKEAKVRYIEHGRVLLVVYISAHGQLGDDGIPYILPSDGIAGDKSTWISYKEVLVLIEEFLQTGGQHEQNKHVILVLDSCQKGAAERFPSSIIAEPIPAGMIFVQSVSPGQYAWHWTAESMEQEVVKGEETRWGFPRPPSRRKVGSIERVSRARMSVVPISSACVLNRAQEIALPEKRPAVISAFEWLESMKVYGKEFLDDIPDRQASGNSQDINIQYGSISDQHLPVFWVMPGISQSR